MRFLEGVIRKYIVVVLSQQIIQHYSRLLQYCGQVDGSSFPHSDSVFAGMSSMLYAPHAFLTRHLETVLS